MTEADYSEDGYVTTKTGDTGTIVGDDVVIAAFINTRDVTTPPTPTNPSNPTKSTDKALKTGDKSNMYMWLALMICSFAVFASCIYGVKRRSAGSHSRKENE